MKNHWRQRLFALLLCLCLLPVTALGEEPDMSVTRSDFQLSFKLHADAFPPDGQTDFSGWEEFLQKLSLEGVADTQRLLDPFDRAYFEGDLKLNGRSVIP
ncbi:MAG: hypothetical protein PHI98_14570, partial [Eubacteriales bacterium]|nr:hypothetical protein [Eubacteriales bacterium]